MSLPRKYPPQFQPEDWNAMVDRVNGVTPPVSPGGSTLIFQYPYTYMVRVSGGFFEAIDSFANLAYGGSDWATTNLVDGTDIEAVMAAVMTAASVTGGKVVIATGTYGSHSFTLLDNVDLEFQRGVNSDLTYVVLSDYEGIVVDGRVGKTFYHTTNYRCLSLSNQQVATQDYMLAVQDQTDNTAVYRADQYTKFLLNPTGDCTNNGVAEAGTDGTTTVDASYIGKVNNYYNNCVIHYTSGDAAGQWKTISDFDGSTGTFTTTTFNPAPTVGDAFEVTRWTTLLQMANTDYLTDSTNYEMAEWTWEANYNYINVFKGGTGTQRPFGLLLGGNTIFKLDIANSKIYGVDGDIYINLAAPLHFASASSWSTPINLTSLGTGEGSAGNPSTSPNMYCLIPQGTVFATGITTYTVYNTLSNAGNFYAPIHAVPADAADIFGYRVNPATDPCLLLHPTATHDGGTANSVLIKVQNPTAWSYTTAGNILMVLELRY